MNKYRNTDKDIHRRIYLFILNCFRDIVKKIPKSIEATPIISQLASSLTSMGANDQEADASSSKKDFIAKYMIVKKETKETIYWLSFVRDSKLLTNTTSDSYISECTEILRIVSAILEKTRRKSVI
ncbi:MAG TPA: four helix bundle protein [Patescibacteria group bacterium]|nr:four helix bundle protein [Patescibacteria group bacterium]